MLSALFVWMFTLNAYHKENKPIDHHATSETVCLYKSLFTLKERGIMFGHQDDLAYGVNWKYEPGRSDTREVCGDYPAVYGWELGHLELGDNTNLDSVPFAKMRDLILSGYERGGVITISWHLNNPLTGKSAWDPAPGTVTSILPGGEKNILYNSWLDKVARFLSELKGPNEEPIPVIFRPFHEGNGDWFWWGKSHCTPAAFNALWRYTVQYLRDKKNLHQLLYAFNTDRFFSREEYLERYPGDEWVDIIGFDIYQREMPKDTYMKALDSMLNMLESLARQKKKIPALTEFGGNCQSDSGWWTGTFLPVLKKHSIAYVLGWRNAGLKLNNEFEYYVPYQGEHSANDFISFYKDKQTIFQSDLHAIYCDE